jgi:hypothetical protein
MRYFEIVKLSARHILADTDPKKLLENHAVVG